MGDMMRGFAADALWALAALWLGLGLIAGILAACAFVARGAVGP